MFADSRVEPSGTPGAVKAAGAMQIPVYSTLSDAQVQRVATVVRDVLEKS
jgi:dTDP-4-amino-4,6-dideoxygalactose transaminase